MKKLVAILLAFVCIFSLAACGAPGNGDDPSMAPSSNEEAEQILSALSEQILKSSPNKTVVTSVTGTKDIKLLSELTAVKGELSGKEAALYVSETEVLNDIGAHEAKDVIRETKEYVDGMGLRVDGGDWDRNADNTVVRKIQPYRMNLDATLIKGLLTNEDKTVYIFTVARENVAEVFNRFEASAIASINSDVSVRIETDGAAVTLIQLNYNTKGVAKLENPTVEVKAVYDYSLQSISLLK